MIILSTGLVIFASSFVITLSGALMPGPFLTATISESSRRGFIAGPLMVAGHAVLELLLVFALLLGLALFLQKPVVFAAIAVTGGRHFLTNRRYLGLIAAPAVFLVGFVGYFVYLGFMTLDSIA